jgi:hypothetical protein
MPRKVLPENGESCLRSDGEKESTVTNYVDGASVCKYAPRRNPIENSNEKTRVVEKAVLRGRFCRDQIEVHTQLLGVINSNG